MVVLAKLLCECPWRWSR